jgi:hypothetical protein
MNAKERDTREAPRHHAGRHVLAQLALDKAQQSVTGVDRRTSATNVSRWAWTT